MLQKSRKFSINNIYKLKKKVKLQKKCEYFNFIAYNLKETKKTQFAVVVSKKVNKSAVKRNKIKRKFYAIISSILIQIKEGFVIIVYVKEDVSSLPIAKISKKFNLILLELNLINE